MKRRNNGRGEINTLQNHFTAYLTKSVQRGRGRYLEQLHQLATREYSCDFQEHPVETAVTPDLLADLSIWEVVESEALLRALITLEPRDLEVLFALILYGQTPAEVARMLGLSYQGAMAVYYRAKKKLRKILKGGGQS